MEMHRCLENKLPSLLDESNEVRNFVPLERGSSGRSARRSQKGESGREPAREAARKKVPPHSKEAGGPRHRRPGHLDNNKLTLPLSIVGKTRQGNEGGVGEPTKKEQKTIKSKRQKMSKEYQYEETKDKKQ